MYLEIKHIIDNRNSMLVLTRLVVCGEKLVNWNPNWNKFTERQRWKTEHRLEDIEDQVRLVNIHLNGGQMEMRDRMRESTM